MSLFRQVSSMEIVHIVSPLKRTLHPTVSLRFAPELICLLSQSCCTDFEEERKGEGRKKEREREMEREGGKTRKKERLEQ